MSRRLYTVQNMVDEVRSLLDEEATDTVSDTADILPSLNRAQDYGVDILSRHYEDPYIQKLDLPIIGGVEEYDIPEAAYSGRIEKVEFNIPPKGFYEVRRASYRDISYYESASSTGLSYYYAVVGNKIRFVPAPNGAFNVRLWIFTSPEELVLPQGKITRTDSANNRIVVDAVGSDLTTESDSSDSYVNLVDGHSGVIKGTFQLKNINGLNLNFKTTPTRTTVENRSVLGSMSTLLDVDGVTELIQPDDYVANIRGSCVMYFARPLGNFLIQYAVNEMKSKLGGDDISASLLKKFEEQVESTWAGREQQLRVKKRSKNWGLPYRRYYHNS